MKRIKLTHAGTGRFVAAATLLLSVAATGPLAGQSLLSSRGLGLVVKPQGVRAATLGGVSLGLPGGELSWSNPAGAVGIPAAGLSVSFQLDDFTSTYSGLTAEGSTARFPLIMAAFPFGERWAVTAGFGGYLDQNWALERRDSLLVDQDTVPVLDRVASEGGVARLRLGAGYRLLDRLSVGLGVDLFTGGVTRTSGRIFPDEIEARCCRASWDYSGVGVLASADWNASEAVSLSVGASVGGTLEAQPRDSLGAARSYSLPRSLTAGATARIAPELLVAVGGDWTGWSSLDGALSGSGGARDTWSVQAGVEWDALHLGERAIPIRLGGRQATLPFRASGSAGESDWTKERALTGGTGLVLGGGAASADIGVERGWRGGDPSLDESFWRVMFSVTVLGQ